jgi:hypothetical protein
MLLFSPSHGQIIDRLCILELKKEASVLRGSSTEAFDKEQQACLEFLGGKFLPEDRLERYASLVHQLWEQNKKQWQFEDTIHKLLEEQSASPTYEELLRIAEVARGTHMGNKHRSELVADIDSLFDESVERKMYS